MTDIQTLFGIDFSGSQAPEDNIWITEAVHTEGLTVTSIESARQRLDATGRDAVLEALRKFISSTDNAVFGLDFPFGFPASAVKGNRWETFLKQFVDEFAGKAIDAFPGTFGEAGRLKRDIDYRYAGQSPMSPLVKYQVFYGLRDLLWPLIQDNVATVCPMQPKKEMQSVMIEVYPAATLGHLGLYRTGYKGHGQTAERRRNKNVDGLAAQPDVTIPDSVKEAATASDDALDSLCAAFAAWKAIQNGLEHENPSVEGHLYVSSD